MQTQELLVVIHLVMEIVVLQLVIATKYKRLPFKKIIKGSIIKETIYG